LIQSLEPTTVHPQIKKQSISECENTSFTATIDSHPYSYNNDYYTKKSPYAFHSDPINLNPIKNYQRNPPHFDSNV